MITDEQVMKALDAYYGIEHIGGARFSLINTMRKALEAYEQSKPKPEPAVFVVWNGWNPVGVTLSEEKAKAYAQSKQKHSDLSGDFNVYRVSPLYTTPPTREPLSEDFLMELAEECTTHFFNGVHQNATMHFARAVEKAHGIGVTNDYTAR